MRVSCGLSIRATQREIDGVVYPLAKSLAAAFGFASRDSKLVWGRAKNRSRERENTRCVCWEKRQRGREMRLCGCWIDSFLVNLLYLFSFSLVYKIFFFFSTSSFQVQHIVCRAKVKLVSQNVIVSIIKAVHLRERFCPSTILIRRVDSRDGQLQSTPKLLILGGNYT